MGDEGTGERESVEDEERTETAGGGGKEGLKGSERAETGGVMEKKGVEDRGGHAESGKSEDRDTTEEVEEMKKKNDTSEGTGEKSREETRQDYISIEGIDPDCTECKLLRPPPSPDQLFMCLHALAYKVNLGQCT